MIAWLQTHALDLFTGVCLVAFILCGMLMDPMWDAPTDER